MRIWTGLRRSVARASDRPVDAAPRWCSKRGGLFIYHGKSFVIASCAITFRPSKLKFIAKCVLQTAREVAAVEGKSRSSTLQWIIAAFVRAAVILWDGQEI